MAGRSRGALSRATLRMLYPHRVRVESDLTNCSINLIGGWKSAYRFKDKAEIDGVQWTIFRFSDSGEATRFSEWTIGTLMDPE